MDNQPPRPVIPLVEKLKLIMNIYDWFADAQFQYFTATPRTVALSSNLGTCRTDLLCLQRKTKYPFDCISRSNVLLIKSYDW